jgi:hypothetical protein
LFSRRFYAALILFVLPAVAVLLLLASGINPLRILFLYVVVVSEGAGLTLWTLSKIMTDNSIPVFYPNVSVKSYFPDRNKVETLYEQVRSASKRSGDYRRYTRSEISKVLRNIIDKDSLSPELELLLNPRAENFDYVSTLDRAVTELESEQ